MGTLGIDDSFCSLDQTPSGDQYLKAKVQGAALLLELLGRIGDAVFHEDSLCDGLGGVFVWVSRPSLCSCYACVCVSSRVLFMCVYVYVYASAYKIHINADDLVMTRNNQIAIPKEINKPVQTTKIRVAKTRHTHL